MARASYVLVAVALMLALAGGTALAADTAAVSSSIALAAQTPAAAATPAKGPTPAERFANDLGATRTFKDKDGAVKTVYTIPGIVAGISPTSITITPNNPQSRGGPFTIDGATVIKIGPQRGATAGIAAGDMVRVTVMGDEARASAVTKVVAKQPRLKDIARRPAALRNLLLRLRAARGAGD